MVIVLEKLRILGRGRSRTGAPTGITENDMNDHDHWPDNVKATPGNYPGLWASRLDPKQNNPREIAFASMWLAENDKEFRTNKLGALLGREPTEDEIQISATIIQWLGSNCGMNFLHEVAMRIPEIKRVVRRP
jgi:hypothetical protein